LGYRKYSREKICPGVLPRYLHPSRLGGSSKVKGVDGVSRVRDLSRSRNPTVPEILFWYSTPGTSSGETPDRLRFDSGGVCRSSERLSRSDTGIYPQRG